MDPSGSEELQGFCLVLVIKVLVEMAYDLEPCYSLICPFVHPSARADQSLICVSPMMGFKNAEMNESTFHSEGAEAK